MAAIEGVLFDLDQTLLNRRASLGAFLEHQWSSRPALQSIEIRTYVEVFLERDGNGMVPKDRVYGSIAEDFELRGLSPDLMEREYLETFEHHVMLFPQVSEALRALRARGSKLAIVTNGRSDLQAAVIRASGLHDMVDAVLHFGNGRSPQTRPEIFARALARIGVAADAAVFVGDNPTADVGGAHKMGMRTIWFENPYFGPPEPATTTAVLRHYSDLPLLIAGMNAEHS